MALRRAATADDAVRVFDTPVRALALLRGAWAVAVGAEIARRSEVLDLSRGTLIVRVPDGRWRRTLHRMQRPILKRLREIAGERAPSRLGFSEGLVPANDAPAPTPTPLEPVPLPAELKASAMAIADEEIRDAFERSAALYLARERRSPGPGR
jgi:hypothetical protein